MRRGGSRHGAGPLPALDSAGTAPAGVRREPGRLEGELRSQGGAGAALRRRRLPLDGERHPPANPENKKFIPADHPLGIQPLCRIGGHTGEHRLSERPRHGAAYRAAGRIPHFLHRRFPHGAPRRGVPPGGKAVQRLQGHLGQTERGQMGGGLHFGFGALRHYPRPRLSGDEPDFHGRHFDEKTSRLDVQSLSRHDFFLHHFRRHEPAPGRGAHRLAAEADAGRLLRLFLASFAAPDAVLSPAVRGGSGGARGLQRGHRRGAVRPGGNGGAGSSRGGVLPLAAAPVQRDADVDRRGFQLCGHHPVFRHAAALDRPQYAHPAGRGQSLRRRHERPAHDRDDQGQRRRGGLFHEVGGLPDESAVRLPGNRHVAALGDALADASRRHQRRADHDLRRLFHHGRGHDRRHVHGVPKPHGQLSGAGECPRGPRQFLANHGNADAAAERRAPL